MKKILYVEDENEIRNIYSDFMEAELDCKVTQASSGNKAIEILASGEEFDLIISDQRMDDGTGEEVFKYVNENLPTTPFFLLSAYSIDEIPSFFEFEKDYVFHKYLNKPINPTDLAQWVEKYAFRKVNMNPEEIRERLASMKGSQHTINESLSIFDKYCDNNVFLQSLEMVLETQNRSIGDIMLVSLAKAKIHHKND